MNWLQTRTPRERYSLYIMGGLIALFLLWQFIINPVFTARSQAFRAQDTALRDYVIVRDGVGAIGASSAANVNLTRFDRAAIVTLARDLELPISRVQPDGEDGIKVWFENAKSNTLYTLLTRLTQSYDATIERVQIGRNDDGTISAQLTIRAGQ